MVPKLALPKKNAFKEVWQIPANVGINPLPYLSLPQPIRYILARRCFNNEKSINELLNPKQLPKPEEHFPDLEKAIIRIKQAISSREQIAICGDYDADGMTSSALLWNVLNKLGGSPNISIPSRMEDGYGLNVSMIDQLYTNNIKLIITVDNGVSAKEALALAKKRNIDVILTDHHTIPNYPLEIFALIHPDVTPSESPYKNLAGVGLAFMIAMVLSKEYKNLDLLHISLDLFCIGTIADMATLLGANRIWLKKGLKTLHNTKCLGLLELQKISGLNNNPINSEHIGFQLAPRINAVGRIGKPDLIIKLLTTESKSEAKSLSAECNELNNQRKLLCKKIETEALSLIEPDLHNLPPFILLAQSHWHHGVVGIVCSKISQKFNRPTALLSSDKDGTFRGSVRSPKGFKVDDALGLCKDNLISYGGHSAAGGFTVKANQVLTLHQKLNNLATKWLSSNASKKTIAPEALINLKDINMSFLKSMEILEPYGIGNPSPIFWSRRCNVIYKNKLKGGHIKLRIEQCGVRHECIGWDLANIYIPDKIDIAFNIQINECNNQTRIQLQIISIRPSYDEITLIRNSRKYRCELKPDKYLEIYNSNNRKIRATLLNTGEIQLIDEKSSNYIHSLFEEAFISFGLLH